MTAITNTASGISGWSTYNIFYWAMIFLVFFICWVFTLPVEVMLTERTVMDSAPNRRRSASVSDFYKLFRDRSPEHRRVVLSEIARTAVRHHP